MNDADRQKIRAAAERLQDQSGHLIAAIDSLANERDRKALRRSYAELIAFIEEKFVFDLKHP